VPSVLRRATAIMATPEAERTLDLFTALRTAAEADQHKKVAKIADESEWQRGARDGARDDAWCCALSADIGEIAASSSFASPHTPSPPLAVLSIDAKDGDAFRCKVVATMQQGQHDAALALIAKSKEHGVSAYQRVTARVPSRAGRPGWGLAAAASHSNLAKN
jgi:hypothetical protein